MGTPDDSGNSRRDFLKLASVSAPAAVAAAAMGGTPAEAATPQATGETRLQQTAHTRAYLDSARF